MLVVFARGVCVCYVRALLGSLAAVWNNTVGGWGAASEREILFRFFGSKNKKFSPCVGAACGDVRSADCRCPPPPHAARTTGTSEVFCGGLSNALFLCSSLLLLLLLRT